MICQGFQKLEPSRFINCSLLKRIKPYIKMTSMVTGQLEDAISLHSILTAMFPCGSITGAPKQSTMTYIKHLETSPRYIYCGTIGLLLPDDKMIFNIPIRTVEYRNNMALYG